MRVFYEYYNMHTKIFFASSNHIISIHENESRYFQYREVMATIFVTEYLSVELVMNLEVTR